MRRVSENDRPTAAKDRRPQTGGHSGNHSGFRPGSDRVQMGELKTVSENDRTTDDGMSGGEAARGRFRRLSF